MKKKIILCTSVLFLFLASCSLNKGSSSVGNFSSYSESLTSSSNINDASSEKVYSPSTDEFVIYTQTFDYGQTRRIYPKFKEGVKDKELVYSLVKGDKIMTVNGDYFTADGMGEALYRAYKKNEPSKYTFFRVVSTGLEGYYKVGKNLYASEKAGTYSEGFDLFLTTNNPDYQIYYTTDGSIPTRNSNRYSGSIEIKDHTNDDFSSYPLTTSVKGDPTGSGGSDKCYSDAYYNNIERNRNYPRISRGTVLTITIFDKDFNPIENTSLTYIVKDDAESYFSVPVISLSMPYENWFTSSGIYNDIFADKRMRTNLEYFDSTTGENFYYNSQVKIGGGWTRGYPQRTLHLNFNKDENDKKNNPTSVSIFGDAKMDGDGSTFLNELTRFRLHNGGNCYESSTHFNDALLHQLAQGSNVATTSYRPCIVYLNGEYWGYYAIREHYSDVFFADNYGVDKNDVIYYDYAGDFILEDGDEFEGKAALDDLLDFLKHNSLENDSNYYYYINNYIDKDSFLDALIIETFAHNWDYVANKNNFRMWRTAKKGTGYGDGKWRVGLHDVDFGLTTKTGSYLVPTEYSWNGENTTQGLDWSYDKFILYSSLLDNAHFRKDLCERTHELMTTNFAPENSKKVLKKMVDEIKNVLPDHEKRWGMNYDSSSWREGVAWVEEVLTSRPHYIDTIISSMYGYYEETDAKDALCVNNYNGSNALYSESKKINNYRFDVEFYATYRDFNRGSFCFTSCRCGVLFKMDDNSESKLVWDPSYWDNMWIENGSGSIRADYINIGTHKFHLSYNRGALNVTIDDYFKGSFRTNRAGKVTSISFYTIYTKAYFYNINVDLSPKN